MTVSQVAAGAVGWNWRCVSITDTQVFPISTAVDILKPLVYL